ncbi:hypothetical protein HDU97_008569 [Phlyctochytrium planicorne]|nr:hypothetical protein HDU97_008569 [Phlyctochytrium planicorne]
MTPRTRDDEIMMPPSPTTATDAPLLPKLRVGCVPEHFSAPLYLGVMRGEYQRQGVDVEIVNCPGGTGEMIRLLASGDIDVACALTEGLIAPLSRYLLSTTTPPSSAADAMPPSVTSIAPSAPSQKQEQDPGYRLIGTYTSKPLTWSIAVNPSSSLSKLGSGSLAFLPQLPSLSASRTSLGHLDDLEGCDALDRLRGARIGVSRIGSGSYIIPFVMAQQRGWVKESEKEEFFEFKECKDLEGLRKGIRETQCDAFLWERFTTKPFYDSGELHHYANVTPPWPAFLFAARTSLLSPSTPSTAHPSTQKPPAPTRTSLNAFLRATTTSTASFLSSIQTSPTSTADMMARDLPFLSRGVKKEDMVQWMETVGYPEKAGEVDSEVVRRCLEALGEAGVAPSVKSVDASAVEGAVGDMCGGAEGISVLV